MDLLGLDICPILEPSLGLGNGIEAFDVCSLLEQFEEASQSSEDSSNVSLPSPDLSRSKKVSEKNDKPSMNVTPGKTSRVKFGLKRKGAILLPLGVPSGRGRGKAQAISPSCSTSKIQKILLKNSTVTPGTDTNQNVASDHVPITSSIMVTQSDGDSDIAASPMDSTEDQFREVSPTYYSEITDHDYCQNFPASLSLRDKEPSVPELSEISQEVLQLHDPASTQFNETITQDPKLSQSKTQQFTSIKKKITAKEYKHRYRNYRKKDDCVKSSTTDGKFFDKIPSYFTTLSLPLKPPKKDSKAIIGGGIRVADLIHREISPSFNNSSDIYNKLPAYHNCFINSTKYDESPATSISEIETLNLKNTKYPWDRLRDRISRDNSRSNSPLAMLNARCESKSREMSCSPRASRSASRSPLPRRYRLSCSTSGSSCNSSYSRSRSRSHGRSQKRRQRQRERGHSYSSYSSRSSDSDWDSRSRSRSRSYSRSRSRDRINSRSPLRRQGSRGQTRSRSPVRRSRSRRSSSYERRKAERHQLREEEKKRQIEERRIVYVGKIPESYTRRQLRQRFEKFGEIEETSVHFRETGDNYGFVTFAYTCDAYAAIENGNKVVGEERFDLCFGGRREFCRTDYADLDGEVEEEEENCFISQKPAQTDFDQLLQAAKRKMMK